MTTKKDTSVHLDTDDGKKEQDTPPPPDPHEEIKNAHAAGLGAMGRPDEAAEKPKDQSSPY